MTEWLKRKVRNFGLRIFASYDAQAVAHGLIITETYWGLGRKYHDPRFDSYDWDDGF